MNQRLIDRVVRTVPWTPGDADPTPLVEREWIVTNGLGGYSSGTVAGVVTRRYHGLLVAALPNPLGRQVMLASLGERVALPDGTEVALGGDEASADALTVPGAARLQSFPDGFSFCGTMNPAFRQIGNAVPPLLAKAVATQIMKTLRQTEQEEADEPRRAAAAVS